MLAVVVYCVKSRNENFFFYKHERGHQGPRPGGPNRRKPQVLTSPQNALNLQRRTGAGNGTGAGGGVTSSGPGPNLGGGQ